MKFTHRTNHRRQSSTPHKNNQPAGRTYSTPESIHSQMSSLSGNSEQIKSSPKSPSLSQKPPESLTRQTFSASTPNLSSSTERSSLRSTQSNAINIHPITLPDTPTPKQRTPRTSLASIPQYGQPDINGFVLTDINPTHSSPKNCQITTTYQSNAKYQSYAKQATSTGERPARASLSDEKDARDDEFPKFEPYDKSPKSCIDIRDDLFKTIRTDISTYAPEGGFLYIFALESHPGFLKIGRTKNAVKNRLQEVSKCFLPSVLRVIWCRKVELHERLESLIFCDMYNYRRKFQCRRHGFSTNFNGIEKWKGHDEWFEIKQEDAIAIAEKYVN
ncbi:MAG: hypothetical protein LQ342_001425 [Letrouitia transgressa]|nr:MAG: hypothetical protein LQ342_001425 [Letrouitia transgressa]